MIVDGTATGAADTGSRLWLTFERRDTPLLEGINVIGRAADAAIPIDSPGISRLHAKITVSHGLATLEDLGSKNGTHLHGTRIMAPCVLADGHEIRLGSVVLTFRIASHVGPTETLPLREG